MSEFDLSAYLGVFLDEVEEQLQILSSEILKLEQDPTNMHHIQEIFRAAHTLKGSSAAMGFSKMKELTHHLENVFELIRQQEVIVTEQLINILFESIDKIAVLKEAIANSEMEEVDITSLVQRLDTYAVNVLPLLDETQQFMINSASEQGYRTVEITFQLLETALMKNVRALVIHNQVLTLGDIIATNPSIELLEQETSAYTTFSMTVVTTHNDAFLQDALQNLQDVESLQITKWQEANEQLIELVEKPSVVEPLVPKVKVNPTVRVDVEKLEHLMNLVGELVIDQTRLIDVRGRFALKGAAYDEEYEVLEEVTNHLSRVIAELQEGMMKTRMLPIEQMFNRFPRMVRDIAQKAGKNVQFQMEGKETELDRTLIEEISDPIIHLLRNAIDHGIEPEQQRVSQGKSPQGTIVLKAAHLENHIVISITDDGKGINVDDVKRAAVEKGQITQEEAEKMSPQDAMFLIFYSGVSTAASITDISGRGVGMDIVKTHIEKLNGIIDIESTVGQGTTFTIKLPLTLAIIRSLLVRFGTKKFAIPLINVLEIIRLQTSEIQVIKQQEVGVVRGRVLPLIRMNTLLQVDEEQQERQKKREFVIVVGLADKRIGLIADEMIGNQEIVIKSLGGYIGSPPYISGATIMGDGDVALILDVSTLVRDQGMAVYEDTIDVSKQQDNVAQDRQIVTFNVAHEEYGIDVQYVKDIIAVPKITTIVDAATDVLGMMNLRGEMIPVIDLRRRFGLEVVPCTKKSRVIVVEQQQRYMSFVVDEVTEVVHVHEADIDEMTNEETIEQSQFIAGVFKKQERIILLIALQRLMQQHI